MSARSAPVDNSKSTTTTGNNCQVCGDTASIVNYGALTCASCRTFFRRNGFNIKVSGLVLANNERICVYVCFLARRAHMSVWRPLRHYEIDQKVLHRMSTDEVPRRGYEPGIDSKRRASDDEAQACRRSQPRLDHGAYKLTEKHSSHSGIDGMRERQCSPSRAERVASRVAQRMTASCRMFENGLVSL